MNFNRTLGILIGSALMSAAGCGTSDSTANQQGSTTPPAVPPTASIESLDHNGLLDPIEGELASPSGPVRTASLPSPPTNVQRAQSESTSQFEPDSELRLLERISQLRSAPKDRVLQPVPGQPGKEEVVLLSPEQVLQEQARRNREIIQLAQQAIVKTHHDLQQVTVFNSALDALSEARLQLALNGDLQQAKLLESDAEELFRNDPTSFAAVESAFRVLRFSQTQAQRHASQDQKWVVAYANQARLFAERFPNESSRAAIHLLGAATLCDSLGISELALSCLNVIDQKFPASPYSEQSVGMQRRLNLLGHRLDEFAGSTLAGGHVDIQQFRGRPLLIMFWASNSETFQADVPRIQQAIERLGGRLRLLGVNLDRDEFRATRFAQESLPNSEHIFYSDHTKRGTKNVIAEYYAVERIPSYWLVDAEGIVRSTNQSIPQLEAAVAELLKADTVQAQQQAIDLQSPVTLNQR